LSLILNIETTTKACSVSLAKEGKTISLCESVEGAYSHSKLLTVYIQKLFTESKYVLKDIDAVAVSKGPGSYTGLRIGVSAAKGIAYGLNIPLISINTLKAMAHTAASGNDNPYSLFCPMTDARRLEVYAAIFDSENNLVRKTGADIIDENSYMEYLSTQKMYFFGDGAAKCKNIITHENAVFIDDIFPSAKDLSVLSFEKFKNNDFENTAYFEPFYLKDFVASVPTKNIYA